MLKNEKYRNIELQDWLRKHRLESFSGLVWHLNFTGAIEICNLAISQAERMPDIFDSPLWDDINRRLASLSQANKTTLAESPSYDDLINDAKRVIVSYAIKYGCSLELDIKIIDGNIALPALAKNYKFNKKKQYLNIKVVSGVCLFDGVDFNSFSFSICGAIQVGSQEFFLKNDEPIYKKWFLSSTRGLPLPCGAENKLWIRSAKQANFILNRYCPSLNENVAPFLSDIFQTSGPNKDQSFSLSSKNMIGAVLASPVDGFELIEMLIHENEHSYLNILMQKFSFFAHNNSNYYSPLKENKRPPSALMHAFLSFLKVAQYYDLLFVEVRLKNQFFEKYAEIILMLKILNKIIIDENFLTEEGRNFFMEAALDLDRLTTHAAIQNELIHERLFHLEKFSQKYSDPSMKVHLSAVEKFLVAQLTESEIKTTKEFFKAYDSLSFTHNIDFLWDNRGPFLIRGRQVFPDNFLSKNYIQLNLGGQVADIIDINLHRGDGHTQLHVSDLSGYMDMMENAKSNMYLGEQCINDWEGVNSESFINQFLQGFFINNDQLLLFLNKKGTRVKLHYDSGNNFHFNIWGKKTFFLIPPLDGLNLYESMNGYGLGFSPVDPFEDSLDKYPDFPMHYGKSVTLESNDCLFIPSGWWHAVRYEENALSVSCFDIY